MMFTLADILAAVSYRSGVPVEVITGHEKHKATASARSVACYLARRFTELSLTEIARGIGYRDHTSVCSAVKLVERMLVEKPLAPISKLAKLVSDELAVNMPRYCESIVGSNGSREIDFGPERPMAAGAAE